jgi:transcriptional regulator with XRE-family HTH domain
MKVNGAKIKDIRIKRGLSREALAIKAGVTAQAVLHWEAGGVNTFSLLAKVADLLEVNEAVLLEAPE